MLVLGGGDGLAVREILKYPDVEKITLVDLDPEMTKLFSTNPMLTALNHDSLTLATRCTSSTPTRSPGSARIKDMFDFVVVDFPDPTNYSLGKLYTTAFYRAAGAAPQPAGPDRGAEHVAAVRAAVLLVHRRDAEAGGAEDVSLSRLCSVVRRMGLRAGGAVSL